MKKVISVFLAVVLMAAFSICASAVYGDTIIPVKTLNKVLDAYRKAIKNGETYVSLSEYGIYNDAGGKTYNELFTAFTINNGNSASFTFGKYSETYVTLDIQGKTGENFTGVKIEYPERYRLADGKADMEMIKKDNDLISKRYREALSLVDRSMTDVEKALVLYDYVILCAEYPDPIGTDIDGGDIYSSDSHVVTGLLRDGIGVCSGYAKLYGLLLNDSGVPAITVYSSKMNHEWVMVKIDGNWYHADPTWDDPRYENGFTEFLDPTVDNWDIGAVTHYYFLKSDEEIRELEHDNWDISFVVNPDYLTEAPISGKSGAFDDMFFSDKNPNYFCISSMSYINGNWYFTDLLNHAIVRIPPDKSSEAVPFPDEEYPKYSFGYENELYISTNHSIYRYDTISDNFDKILEIPTEEAATTRYSEMRVLFDEMTLIIIRSNDSDDTFTTFDSFEQNYSMDELRYKKAIVSPFDDPEPAKTLKRDPIPSEGGGKKPLVTTAAGSAVRTPETTDNDIPPYISDNKPPVTTFIIIGACAAVVIISVITVIKKRGR